MRTHEMRLLIAFDRWVNRKLLATAAALTDEQFRDPADPTLVSLRATLVHLLDVAWWWRLHLTGEVTEDHRDLQATDFPDLPSLRARWDEDEAAHSTWLASLGDDDLQRPVMAGFETQPFPLWQYLMHMTMHSRQLQADAATILTGLGHSPGEIDFLVYLRERPSSP